MSTLLKISDVFLATKSHVTNGKMSNASTELCSNKNIVVSAEDFFAFKRAYEILQMLMARLPSKRNPAWHDVRKNITECTLLSFVKDWDNMPEGFRRCTHCGEVKPLDDFFNRRTVAGKAGKHTQCKWCLKIVKKTEPLPFRVKRNLREKHEHQILADNYIRQLLKQNTNLATTDFGSEIIDLHRKLLILKRERRKYG